MQYTNFKTHDASRAAAAPSGPRMSPGKRKFIEYLKNKNSNQSEFSEIKEKIGISRATYYRWLKDSNLRKIVKEESDLEFRAAYHPILRTIKNNAIQGNIKAAVLYLDIRKNTKDKPPKRLTPDEVIRIIKNIRDEKKKTNDNSGNENQKN